MKRTRFMKKCMSDKNELILLNTYNGTMVVVNPGQVHDYEYVHVLLGKHADTGNVVRNQTAHAGDSAVLTSMYSAMRRS